MTRIFFSAGESSGDIHGANLIRALRHEDPGLACEGLGGQRMAEAGMELRHDLAERAIMGFVEIIRAFPYIRRLFNETVAYLRQTPPDLVVVIDYPGFNLRLAKRCKALGIPVVYYISPQVWAWKKKRIYTIAENVEKMLVILPFEKEIYDEIGLDCTYVGHPLLDHIQTVDATDTFKTGRQPVIGLLPGSREQEIERIMPTLIAVARGIREAHPDARFIVPCVDTRREDQIKSIAGDFPLETAVGLTYDVLQAARFCLVASGTATVETTLFRVPMIVIYKVAPLTYWLAKKLVNVEAIAMVNILAGKKIVPEFVQDAADPETILPLALTLIEDSPERKTMIDGLDSVRRILGDQGASKTAARETLDVVRRRAHA